MVSSGIGGSTGLPRIALQFGDPLLCPFFNGGVAVELHSSLFLVSAVEGFEKFLPFLFAQVLVDGRAEEGAEHLRSSSGPRPTSGGAFSARASSSSWLARAPRQGR